MLAGADKGGPSEGGPLSIASRRTLAARLAARREEIQRATLKRVHPDDGPANAVSPEYAIGLREAVSAAVGFGLEAVERDDGSIPSIPTALLAQARLAACNDVGLEIVLRRYAGGYSLLSQLVAAEAEDLGLPVADLLEIQTVLFDRVVAAVTEEHGRARPASVHQRRIELVKALLAGDRVDISLFPYDFDVHHVGLVARGSGAEDLAESMAVTLGCRWLAVAPAENTVWCWFGHREPTPLERLGHEKAIDDVCVAVGEVGRGVAGWRRSHQQAEAAFALAARQPGALIHYRDAALLSSMAQDELLTASLNDIYVAPLRSRHRRSA